jgi:hypothetical protein
MEYSRDNISSLDETFQLIKAVIALRDEVHDLSLKVREFMSKPEFKHSGCLIDEAFLMNKYKLSYKTFLRLRRQKLLPYVRVRQKIYYSVPEIYSLLQKYLNNVLIKNDLRT